MLFCADQRALLRKSLKPGFVTLLLALAPTLYAAEGVISGFFRGNEMQARTIGQLCDEDGSALFSYRSLQLEVSASGDYDFSDTGHHYDLDTQLAIYTSFNPDSPTRNRVGFVNDGFESDRTIGLQAGLTYTLVVQACGSLSDRRGDFSFAYFGPGTLTGQQIYPTPAYSSGFFDGSEPTLPEEIFCGNTWYRETTAIRVPQSGDYVFSDSSMHYAVDIVLAIYRDGFNAASPFDNLLTMLDDGGTVSLEQGVDYYFVVMPLCDNIAGDFRYVLMGPSDTFLITEGVNGAWYNTETPGQGILMEAYPDIPLLFAAWFTWDTTPPANGDTAVIGDPNHRWLTAQGDYQGDTATMPVSVTRGGIFDDPRPVSAAETVGTMTIQFLQCNAAQVDYEVDGTRGSFTMNKLANDNNATCEVLSNQQKVPLEPEQQ